MKAALVEFPGASVEPPIPEPLGSVREMVETYVPPLHMEDHLIASEATLYRMSPVQSVVPFVAWLVIRGFGSFAKEAEEFHASMPPTASRLLATKLRKSV